MPSSGEVNQRGIVDRIENWSVRVRQVKAKHHRSIDRGHKLKKPRKHRLTLISSIGMRNHSHDQVQMKPAPETRRRPPSSGGLATTATATATATWHNPWPIASCADQKQIECTVLTRGYTRTTATNPKHLRGTRAAAAAHTLNLIAYHRPPG